MLNVATYGLVNANAKWQRHSDTTFINLGLKTVAYIPQLFYLRIDTVSSLVVVKIVDDFLVGGTNHAKNYFLEKLSSVYVLGTITHLPGRCLFYGLQLTQNDDFSIHVDADNKLLGLTPHTLGRSRRKESADDLNDLELFHFNSVNGSIGFVGVHASPIASYVSSYLQQVRNSTTVHDLTLQCSMLRRLYQLGSNSVYKRPVLGYLQLSVLVFSDAGRAKERGQLEFLCGLLLGELKKGSVFHVLSWSSHLSKRPAKSIGSAEVLAAGSAIDEGILTSSALHVLLNAFIPVIIAVDSKYLFDSLSSCHVPEDKAIRADVQLIRYYFETKKIQKMIWIPGSLNLADPLSKMDSRLSDALQLFYLTVLYPLTSLGPKSALQTTTSDESQPTSKGGM